MRRAYLAHPRLRGVRRVVLFPDAGVRTTIKPDDGRNAVHHMGSPLIATVNLVRAFYRERRLPVERFAEHSRTLATGYDADSHCCC